MSHKLVPLYIGDGEYYTRIDADNVIAEKDAEIAELKAENERLRGESCKLTDGCLRLKQCRKEKANIADELRHSNHMRCLAMAKWCHNQREIYERDSYDWELDRDAVVSLRNKANIMRRWCKRWLALAEEPTWAKFLQLIHKEAK